MKYRGVIVLLCLTTALLAVGASSSWGGPIYRWTDEAGNAGFTDDPAKIPEKYRRNAILENALADGLEKNPGSKANGTSSPAREPAPPLSDEPPTDDAGHDELYWRERIGKLKTEKEALSLRRATLDTEADALSNPLVNSRGEQRSRYQELQLQVAELDQKIAAIEHQIRVVIPDEARKFNAPPGWLRE